MVTELNLSPHLHCRSVGWVILWVIGQSIAFKIRLVIELVEKMQLFNEPSAVDESPLLSSSLSYYYTYDYEG